MREREIENQFKVLQQEIALVGEEVEALKRDHRALKDALHLEVETIRRCLERLDPDSKGCFVAVRAEVLQEIDPEAI